ncbi:unnamed protein product [Moneuplotes crassus]|uniref:Uncharacterized protein n=1 Tax=Euplotes crassus TaxID=5936 RepID=A0AAD1Y211_EUPCR|nr:unnamed protein product [Moneuplotes crassus]
MNLRENIADLSTNQGNILDRLEHVTSHEVSEEESEDVFDISCEEIDEQKLFNCYKNATICHEEEQKAHDENQQPDNGIPSKGEVCSISSDLEWVDISLENRKDSSKISEKDDSFDIKVFNQPVHPSDIIKKDKIQVTPFRANSCLESSGLKNNCQDSLKLDKNKVSDPECKQFNGDVDLFLSIYCSTAEINQTCTKDMKSKREELIHLRKENQKLEAQTEALRKNILSIEDQSLHLNSELEESEKANSSEIDILEAQILDLQESESRQSSLLEKKSVEIQQLNQNLQVILKKKVEISNKVHSEKKSRALLNSQFVKTNEKLEVCYDQKRGILRTLKRIQEQRDRIVAELEQYKSKCTDLQSKLDSTQTEFFTANKTNSQVLELRSSKALLKLALENKSKQLATLQDQYIALKKSQRHRLNVLNYQKAINPAKSYHSGQSTKPNCKDTPKNPCFKSSLQKALDEVTTDNQNKSKMIHQLKHELSTLNPNKKIPRVMDAWPSGTPNHIQDDQEKGRRQIQSENSGSQIERPSQGIYFSKFRESTRTTESRSMLSKQQEYLHTSTFGYSRESNPHKVDSHHDLSQTEVQNPEIYEEEKIKDQTTVKESLSDTCLKEEIMKELRNAHSKLDHLYQNVLYQESTPQKRRERFKVAALRCKKLRHIGPFQYGTTPKKVYHYGRHQRYSRMRRISKVTQFSPPKKQVNHSVYHEYPLEHSSGLRILDQPIIRRNCNMRGSRSFDRLHY